MANNEKKITKTEEEISNESDEKVKLSKDEKKEAKKKAKQAGKGLWSEFKKFVSRGNVVDMSVAVVIGGAFGAIVTALTNIFLSICTWAVPGGLKGLVTVLPAANVTQQGWIYNGEIIVGQSFSTSQIYEIAEKIMGKVGKTNVQDVVDMLTSRYTMHGGTYVYNGAAIIDWGTFLNSILAFIVIAIVLFAILKSFSTLQKYRALAKAKALEAYYKKHPDERPAPVDPKKPELTERQLLKEILTEMKNNNKNKSKKEMK